MQIPSQADGRKQTHSFTTPERDRGHKHGDGDECLSEGRPPADRWRYRPDCHTNGHKVCCWGICERRAGQPQGQTEGPDPEPQAAKAAAAQAEPRRHVSPWRPAASRPELGRNWTKQPAAAARPQAAERAADGAEKGSPNRQRTHWLQGGQVHRRYPNSLERRSLARRLRVGRPEQVVWIRLLGQDRVDVALHLVGLQLGQDGDEAAAERGRDLREEREELFIGAHGVLQRVLEAGREHSSTTSKLGY